MRILLQIDVDNVLDHDHLAHSLSIYMSTSMIDSRVLFGLCPPHHGEIGLFLDICADMYHA
jgi:hypothetical protein